MGSLNAEERKGEKERGREDRKKRRKEGKEGGRKEQRKEGRHAGWFPKLLSDLVF